MALGLGSGLCVKERDQSGGTPAVRAPNYSCIWPALLPLCLPSCGPLPLIHLCIFPSSIHLPIHSPPIRRFPSRPIHLAIYLPTIHLLLINLPPTHLLSIIFPFTQPPTSHHMAAIHPFTHHPNTQFWALDLKEGDRSCAALPQETVQWDKCGEP